MRQANTPATSEKATPADARTDKARTATKSPAGARVPAQRGNCVVIRPGDSYEGKQGLNLSTGISSTSAGSQALCMHLVVIPPGSRGTPHVHEGHETAIYIASGEVEVWHGAGLAGRTVLGAGDFLYIPAGVPHLPVNRGDETMTCVIARTDPSEQESVVTLDLPPHLNSLEAFPVAAG